MDFNIAGANTAGLRTSQSHQESGSQGVRDYALAKQSLGFFVEALVIGSNTTHWNGSEAYEDCTHGLDVYRLLNRDGDSYPARKKYLIDDYRKALEDSRNGIARTNEVNVRELNPCQYCMEEINKAYLDGEFLEEQNLDIGFSKGDLDLLA